MQTQNCIFYLEPQVHVVVAQLARELSRALSSQRRAQWSGDATAHIASKPRHHCRAPCLVVIQHSGTRGRGRHLQSVPTTATHLTRPTAQRIGALSHNDGDTHHFVAERGREDLLEVVSELIFGAILHVQRRKARVVDAKRGIRAETFAFAWPARVHTGNNQISEHSLRKRKRSEGSVR